MEIAEFTLPIRDLVTSSKQAHLVIEASPSLDELASALVWRNQFLLHGKTVQILTNSIDLKNYPPLPGMDQIQSPLPKTATQIRLQLTPAKIAKVSWAIEGNELVFNLEPQSVALSNNQVKVEHKSPVFDLVLILGQSSLPSSALSSANAIVDLDVNSKNERYGQLNIIDTNAGSLCQLTAKLFTQLNWPLDNETATLLFAGIISATNDFKKLTNAETFQIAALLTKSGADVKLANKWHSQTKKN